MGSKVVSTKLTEEEYGKLVGLCSTSGDTVSKLLKKAILSRMNEEAIQNPKTPQKQIKQEPEVIPKPRIKRSLGSDDRFLYY